MRQKSLTHLFLVALPIILFFAIPAVKNYKLNKGLWDALAFRNYDKAEVLISQGADGSAKNKNGTTARQIIAKGKASGLKGAAIANDSDQVLKWIKKGADVNAPSGDGDSLLMCLIRYNGREQVPLLEKAGAKKTDQEELIVAAYMGRLPVVQKLLSKGVNVEVKDIDGDSALSYAAAEGHILIIKALIAAGANVNNKSLYKETPLIWAIKGEHKEAIRLLKRAGAKKF